MLRAARVSAHGRRLRVSFAVGQAGWAFWVIGLTPTSFSPDDPGARRFALANPLTLSFKKRNQPGSGSYSSRFPFW